MSLVYGSDLVLATGMAGTPGNATGYTPESFSGESTVVLGAPSEDAMTSFAKTEARWQVPVPKHYLKHFKQGFLVIACVRYYGGLHTLYRNTRATIFLNGNPVDFVDLRIIPDHHSDYFHRLPPPEFPKIMPLANCRTVYGWPVLPHRLIDGPHQTVSVSLDSHIWWDIDYVGFVMEALIPEPAADMATRTADTRVFLCHGSEDKAAVRELYKRLEADGLRPWLDEKDILPGEEWTASIRKAIKTSRFVLVCLSPKSVSKIGYIQKEIAIALDRAEEQPEGVSYIIPVCLEPCDVPERLRRWQYVRLFEDGDYDRLLIALRRGGPS